MCQTWTSQSSFPSSTRCQVLCMRGQLRHALWAGKWRGRYLHPCNKNRGKGDPAQIINFLFIIYFNSKHSCPSTSRLLSSFMVLCLRNWTKTALWSTTRSRSATTWSTTVAVSSSMSTKVFYLRDKDKNKVKGADSKLNKAKIVLGSQKCFKSQKMFWDLKNVSGSQKI